MTNKWLRKDSFTGSDDAMCLDTISCGLLMRKQVAKTRPQTVRVRFADGTVSERPVLRLPVVGGLPGGGGVREYLVDTVTGSLYDPDTGLGYCSNLSLRR